jgi:hypothetical protein
MTNINQKIEEGRDALQKLQRAIPTTHSVDLVEKETISNFGQFGSKVAVLGEIEDEHLEENERLAINNSGVTCMLLNKEQVQNLMGILEEAEEKMEGQQ